MSKSSTGRSGQTLTSNGFLSALRAIEKPRPVTLIDLAMENMPAINDMLEHQGYTLQSIVTGLKKQFPGQSISEDGLRRARLAWYEAKGEPAPDLRNAKATTKSKTKAKAKPAAATANDRTSAPPAAPADEPVPDFEQALAEATDQSKVEPVPSFEDALEEATSSIIQSR